MKYGSYLAIFVSALMFYWIYGLGNLNAQSSGYDIPGQFLLNVTSAIEPDLSEHPECMNPSKFYDQSTGMWTLSCSPPPVQSSSGINFNFTSQ